MKAWTNGSISKKLYVVILIYCSIIVTASLLSYFGMSILSGVRAYVGAEGIWSRHQKDGAYHLARYAATREEAHYQAYLNAIEVMLSDKKARLELEKPNPDWALTRQGLLGGKVHPDDIDIVIFLFRQFRQLDYIAKAIEIWAEGDRLISDLQVLGEALHREVSSGGVASAKVDMILKDLDALNRELTDLEQAFSATLGEASRWVKGLLLKVILGVSFTFLAGGLAISLSLSRSIIEKLRRVSEIAARVASGDLTLQSEVGRLDEIGRFAQMFNTMTQNLREMILQIREKAAEVSAASEEMSASGQQMGANSEQTEKLASTVSSASEQTNRNVQTVATAAEEMTATLKEISQNVMKATRITSEAVAVASITNKTVSKLGESSAEIGKVIKVITSIAEQTNLLALNAAIEAARAGEAGKGFAVVANEVKDLAKKTARATEEIGQKIGVIQTDTKEAVSAIGEITGIITQINEIATTIAGAIEEQTATTNEISRSVMEAARGTGEVTESIDGVVSAAKGTAERATAILDASQRLAKMSSDLMSLVGKFQADPTGERGRVDRSYFGSILGKDPKLVENH
ncbi:MAG: methyl-accepting chemotaxis protein [Candidatus Manganitrophus sp.]|nr:MAG: methyl-accepting chemotaxis protein [Candidatus Manganitrophus sp.]